MAPRESILGKLLNDESFLRWLEGNATPEDQEKWDRWLLKNAEHRRVMEKARKILTMPFKTIRSKHDKSEQLYRLQKKILEHDSNSGAAKGEE